MKLAGSKPRPRRWVIIALCLVSGIAVVRWQRSRSIDPQLIGQWKWSPDPKAGFPMHLHRNGSGQVTHLFGCCAFTRSCRWKVERDELQIYPAPQLRNLSIEGMRTYLGDLWKSAVTSPEPVQRYRILERTGSELRLQPLSADGSTSDGPVEVYRKSVDDRIASM